MMCIFLYTRNRNDLKKNDHGISNKWELHQSSIFLHEIEVYAFIVFFEAALNNILFIEFHSAVRSIVN